MGKSQFDLAETRFRDDLEREHWGIVKRFESYLFGEKRSELTVRKYCDEVWRFLTWEKKPPEELGGTDTQAYKEYLSQRYSENSMATIIASINVFCEKILEKTNLKQKPPKGVVKAVMPLTEDEVTRISIASRTPSESNWRNAGNNNSDTSCRDYAIICLLYYGGLRRSEIISLHKSDIDYEGKKVRIHSGKGKDWSKINLHNSAIEAVETYLLHARPEAKNPADKEVLFISNLGNRLSKNVIDKLVKKCATKAGIKKRVYLHLFRHSMISHMAEKGVSAPLIQAQSRHHSLDMLQKYIHASDSAVSEAYSRSITLSVEEEPHKGQEGKENAPTGLESISRLSSEERRERLMDMFIQGKITEGTLCKLLAVIEPLTGKADIVGGMML